MEEQKRVELEEEKEEEEKRRKALKEEEEKKKREEKEERLGRRKGQGKFPGLSVSRFQKCHLLTKSLPQNCVEDQHNH